MANKNFDFSPMTPEMGPPLPKGLNILWPQFARRRTEAERAARHYALYGTEPPAERRMLGPRMGTTAEYIRSWLPCMPPGPPVPRWMAVQTRGAGRRLA